MNVFISYVFQERLRASYLLLPGPCLYQILVLCGKCRTHPLRLPVHQTSQKLSQVVSFYLIFCRVDFFWPAQEQKTNSISYYSKCNASYSVTVNSVGWQQCVGFTYRLHGTGSNHRADATVRKVKVCKGKQYFFSLFLFL